MYIYIYRHVLLQLAPFQFGSGAWEVTKIQTMMTFEDEDKPRYIQDIWWYVGPLSSSAAAFLFSQVANDCCDGRITPTLGCKSSTPPLRSMSSLSSFQKAFVHQRAVAVAISDDPPKIDLFTTGLTNGCYRLYPKFMFFELKNGFGEIKGQVTPSWLQLHEPKCLCLPNHRSSLLSKQWNIPEGRKKRDTRNSIA